MIGEGGNHPGDIESEAAQENLEQRAASLLTNMAKETNGIYLSALFDVAKRWQSKLHKPETNKQGEIITPRHVGKDFDETFSQEGKDGIDGRVETINLEQGQDLFIITDIHGDEASMEAALAKVLERLMQSEDVIHFVSNGDFATYENNESIEPLKSFLLLEALKSVKLDGPDEGDSLNNHLLNFLQQSGLSKEETSQLLDKIQNKLKLHFLPGNGELYIPPSGQIADQLGRTVNVLGVKKAQEVFENLPLSMMIRTEGTDVFMSHFLPPLVRKQAWEERGLAAINDENISDLRVEAGVWGGYDPSITDESIAAEAQARGVNSDEIWDIGRHTIGNVAGVRDLTGKRLTYSGFPTFRRILATKGEGKRGVYPFGHESALAGQDAERGYFTQSSEDGEDAIICFHTGGGSKVPKKIMLEVTPEGQVNPIVVREG